MPGDVCPAFSEHRGRTLSLFVRSPALSHTLCSGKPDALSAQLERDGEKMPEEYQVLPGPGRGRAQKIGDLARSVLYARKPDAWEIGEIGGDDYGYDFQAQVFALAESIAQCTVNIQLKGTTQPVSKINGGTTLAYSFDRRTLNLWHRSGLAVVVVIVDLIESTNILEATPHYYFASPDLGALLDSLPADQQTVRLHVPVANLIHQGLDILPLLLPYLDSIRDAQRIAVERQRASGATTTDQLQIEVSTFQVGLSDNAIEEREIDSFLQSCGQRNSLESALSLLRRGDYDVLLDTFPTPGEQLIAEDPHSAALTLYLRSMALDAMGEDQMSTDAATRALELFPDCDPIHGSVAHKEMVAISLESQHSELRNELLEKLSGHTGLSTTIVKAKLHALNRNFEEARKLVSHFSRDRVAVVQTTISMLERDWGRVETEAEDALKSTDLRPRERLLLTIFKARAQFEMALSQVQRQNHDEMLIPPAGLPGTDYAMLRSSFETSHLAMNQAQRLNWPSEISYVIDVYPVSAMVLGLLDSAMPLLAALSLARPKITMIREGLSKVFIQCKKPELALAMHDAAGDSARFENEDLVVAVAAVKAGRPEEAFSLMSDDLLNSDSNTSLYLSSIMMISIAADASLRSDVVSKIRQRLRRDKTGRDYEAIMDSAIRVQQSVLQRPGAIREVFGYWRDNEKPAIIGLHLLDNLNPQDRDEAELFLTIVEDVKKTNSLDEDNYIDQGQSLLTLDRPVEAEAVLREATSRFANNPKLKSLLGIAFEKNGRSHDAFTLFEELLNNGSASESARRYYVEIAVRMGFFVQAENQIRTVLARTQNRDQKLQLLGTLCQLLLAEGNRITELEETAWQFGRFARQDDETQEGTFLQLYLVASAPQNLAIEQERIEEFQRRLNAYTAAFPESGVLWRANIPENAAPGEVQDALQHALRISNDDLKKGIAVERRLNNGSLLIPFSWRPRTLLRNMTDVFMLWELRKKTPIELRAMHFSNSASDYTPPTPEDLGSVNPVISLTSLLLLDELNLLERVLDSFDQIYLARSTILTLQQVRNSFASSDGRARSQRIMELIQRYFAKIVHPPQIAHQGLKWIPAWHEEEKSALALDSTAYFSDDIIETHLTCHYGEAKSRPAITTVDYLRWSEQKESTDQAAQGVAKSIAKMMDLRIAGVTVDFRYFLASIPAELSTAISQEEVEAIAKCTPTFLSMIDSLWDHEDDLHAINTHFANTVSHILTTSDVSEEFLVYLWLRWLRAVRLKTNPPLSPERKLAVCFVYILGCLPDSKELVTRLWRIFWVVVQRGFQNEDLRMPPDKFAILQIATALGEQRVNAELEDHITELFERALHGLEPGTQRSEWLSSTYIDAAAQAALRLNQNQ